MTEIKPGDLVRFSTPDGELAEVLVIDPDCYIGGSWYTILLRGSGEILQRIHEQYLHPASAIERLGGMADD